jgi:hypothetical protein
MIREVDLSEGERHSANYRNRGKSLASILSVPVESAPIIHTCSAVVLRSAFYVEFNG